MKKILFALVAALVVVATVVLVRTARLTSGQLEVEPVAEMAVNAQAAAGRLAQMLRFRTLSHEDPAMFDRNEFLALHDFFQREFPRVHAALTREVVGGYSLLYTWKGQDEDAALKPVLLMGHMDAVPVEPGTQQDWSYPPFAGRIAGGFVWGRGAMDDKAAVLAILEAVEMLLAEGFEPRRTVYLAFGHDEEIGGTGGAAAVASRLESQRVELDWVLDEGGAVFEGLLPGVHHPVAMVNVAEKGYVNFELTVDSPGGHSSMPPPHTAVGVLSDAIRKLEVNPMAASLAGPTRAMLETLAPEMTFFSKVGLANLWLFEGLVHRRLAKQLRTNALIRTTTAATIFQSGVKANILPTRARAVVNFRIRPGETIQGVHQHVRSVIADDRVQIRAMEDGRGPSRVSGPDSEGFRVVERTIREVFPNALVVPGLLTGGTDSVHYAKLTANIYRFSPQVFQPADLARLHGINERTSVAGFADQIRFFAQLIRNSG